MTIALFKHLINQNTKYVEKGEPFLPYLHLLCRPNCTYKQKSFLLRVINSRNVFLFAYRRRSLCTNISAPPLTSIMRLKAQLCSTYYEHVIQ